MYSYFSPGDYKESPSIFLCLIFIHLTTTVGLTTICTVIDLQEVVMSLESGTSRKTRYTCTSVLEITKRVFPQFSSSDFRLHYNYGRTHGQLSALAMSDESK